MRKSPKQLDGITLIDPRLLADSDSGSLDGGCLFQREIV
jgi:hypothetical protein